MELAECQEMFETIKNLGHYSGKKPRKVFIKLLFRGSCFRYF